MKKRLVCFFVIVAMLFSMIPAISFASDRYVDSIHITGFRYPVIGQTAGQNLSTLEAAEGEGYYIDRTYWFNETDSKTMDPDDIFVEGKVYYIGVMLKPLFGFSIRDNTPGTINGDSSLVDLNYCMNQSDVYRFFSISIASGYNVIDLSDCTQDASGDGWEYDYGVTISKLLLQNADAGNIYLSGYTEIELVGNNRTGDIINTSGNIKFTGSGSLDCGSIYAHSDVDEFQFYEVEIDSGYIKAHSIDAASYVSIFGGYTEINIKSFDGQMAAVSIRDDFDIYGGYLDIKCTPAQYGIYAEYGDVDIQGGYVHIEISDPDGGLENVSGHGAGIRSPIGVWNYNGGGILFIESTSDEDYTLIEGDFYAHTGVTKLQKYNSNVSYLSGEVFTNNTDMKGFFDVFAPEDYFSIPSGGKTIGSDEGYGELIFAEGVYCDWNSGSTATEFTGDMDSIYIDLCSLNASAVLNNAEISGAVYIENYYDSDLSVTGSFSGNGTLCVRAYNGSLKIDTNNITFNGSLIGDSWTENGLYFSNDTSSSVQLGGSMLNIIGICNYTFDSGNSGVCFDKVISLSSGNIIGIHKDTEFSGNGISFRKGCLFTGGNVTGYSVYGPGMQFSMGESHSSAQGATISGTANLSGISKEGYGIEFTEKYSVTGSYVKLAAFSGGEDTDTSFYLWNGRTYSLPSGTGLYTGDYTVSFRTSDSQPFGRKTNFGAVPRYTINYYYVVDGEPELIGSQLKIYDVTTQVDDENHPTLEGYTFKGYNTKIDGTGTQYMPGDDITVNEDIDLYTVWKKNKPSIDLNDYEGNAEGDGWSYNASSNRLTLRGARLYDVTLKGDATVELVGYNVLEGTLANRSGSLTINGSGMLTVSDISAVNYITDSFYNIIIDGGYIEAEHISSAGDMLVSGGCTRITTASDAVYYAAVWIDGLFDITGGELSINVTSEDVRYGLYSDSGDVDIVGGLLEITVCESNSAYIHAGIFAPNGVWNYAPGSGGIKGTGGVLIIDARNNSVAIDGNFYPCAGVSQFYMNGRSPVTGTVSPLSDNVMKLYMDYGTSAGVMTELTPNMSSINADHYEYVFACGYMNVISDLNYSGSFTSCYVNVNDASLTLNSTTINGALLIRSSFGYDTTASEPTIAGTPSGRGTVVSISKRANGLRIESADIYLSGTIIGRSGTMTGIVIDSNAEVGIQGDLQIIGEANVLGTDGILVNNEIVCSAKSMIGIGNNYGIDFRKRAEFEKTNITGIHRDYGYGCGLRFGYTDNSSDPTVFGMNTSLSGVLLNYASDDSEGYGIRFCRSAEITAPINRLGAYSDKSVQGVADLSIHIDPMYDVDIPEGTSFKSNIVPDGQYFFHYDSDYFGPSAYYDMNAPQFTVEYRMNYGTPAFEVLEEMTQMKQYNQTLQLSEEIPENTGYIFIGWNTERDGSGTWYYPASEYTGNAVLVLYAQWEIETFYFHGTIISEGSATDDITITITEYGASEPAYELILDGDETSWGISDVPYGYYEIVAEKNGCLDSVYGLTVNEDFEFLEIVLSSKTVMFAFYYDAADEDPFFLEEIPYGSRSSEIATPGRFDAIFTGWYLDRECTEPYVPGNRLYEDLVVFGGWIPAYSISGSVEVDPDITADKIYLQLYEYGSPEPADEFVLMNGETSYEFLCLAPGKYVIRAIVPGTTFDFNTYEVEIEDADVEKDIALIMDVIGVYVYPNNGEGDPDPRGNLCFEFEVPYGRENWIPTDFYKSGYSFIGWFTDSALTEAYDPSEPVLTNFSLYAEWAKHRDVSGSITTEGAASDQIIIQLIEDGLSEPAYEIETDSGNATSYTIYGVAPGTYTMKVMQTGCETAYYTVAVSDSDVTQNIVLKLDKIRFTDVGRSLSLSDIIYINDYIKIESDDYSSDYIKTNGGMMIWNSPVTVTTALYGTQDVLKSGLNYTSSNKRYSQQTDGIAAKNYGDDIYMRFYVKLSDGSYEYSDIYRFSVRDYCLTYFEKGTEDQMKKVCYAILEYGAAAQVQLDYKTDKLSNEGIADEYSQYASSWNTSLIDALNNNYTTSGLTSTGDVSSYGNSLSLSGQIYVNFYFTTTVTNVKKAELLYWNSNTSAFTYANAQKKTMTKSGSRWSAQGFGISAKNYGKTVYACAMITDNNGGVHYSPIVMDSPEDYARRVLASTTTDDNLKDLAKKIVIYGEQARIYFTK